MSLVENAVKGLGQVMEKKKAPTISCITRKGGGKRWLKSLTLTSITKWKQKLLIIDSITGEYTESTHFSQYDNGESIQKAHILASTTVGRGFIIFPLITG